MRRNHGGADRFDWSKSKIDFHKKVATTGDGLHVSSFGVADVACPDLTIGEAFD